MAEFHIITSGRNRGKTTLALKLVDSLEGRIDGFVTVSRDGKENLYIRRIATGEERLVMSRNVDIGDMCGIGYHIDASVFDWALLEGKRITAPIVIIDEVGRLDAQGKGFAPLIDFLSAFPDKKIIMCVRDAFIPMVTERFSPDGAAIHEVGTAMSAGPEHLSDREDIL